MTSVPISSLKIYPDWREAKPGTLLAYASPIFVIAPNKQPQQLDGPKIAIRAESSAGLQQFLVILEPDGYLAVEANDSRQPTIFASVEALNGPAIDLEGEYELRVEPAPFMAHLHTDPKPLTLIQTMGDNPRLFLFAGSIGRSPRYLALEGPDKGKLFERPGNQAFFIGTLTVEAIKRS